MAICACSTPTATINPVAVPKRSVAFDTQMIGCRGIGTKCFGIRQLIVQEVSSGRTLWEVHLPGIRSGRVEYGAIPQRDQLDIYKSIGAQREYWMEDHNPGFKPPMKLPTQNDLVVIVGYTYDSPWPSAGSSRLYFKIDQDGTIIKK